MANSHVILGFYCAMTPRDAFPAAEEAARRATELDPTLAEAHAALAYVDMYYHWDWEAAEARFQEALRLNAGYATAHQWYGNFLALQGRFDESLEQFGHAMALDPLSPLMVGARGWGCYFARRYADAIEHQRRALSLDPDYIVAHLWLGMAIEQAGDVRDAVPEFEHSVRLSGRNLFMMASLGHALALQEDQRPARSLLEQLGALRRTKYVSAYDIAVIHAALGETQDALASLEAGYEERTHWMTLLAVDPRLDPVRREPRFEALLERMNLMRVVERTRGATARA